MVTFEDFEKLDIQVGKIIEVEDFKETRKRVAGFKSEVLVLGVMKEEGEVILIQPEREAPLGYRIG
jgi:tRNA-binding protein